MIQVNNFVEYLFVLSQNILSTPLNIWLFTEINISQTIYVRVIDY